ncbi:Dipeptidyl aminopeptidase BIII [Streptomyces hundungensis]|uniref:Dipeptidyl aminopeptidase BIII n=1 Tax=Streptomyces hundungensis TaxID=1077946 RepID=A0A387H8G3_9ACTN|nr:alpha/beta fold hydrolase [Streptomyces hundungensis]AYG78931.1 Dipeptidyl aminopeptidase BIII [Streptomyces hundungensis]
MTRSYQVYRAALPEVCAGEPTKMVFTADADGRCEVFTWDASTRRARQVTDRPHGTLHGAIDRDARVWWFDEDANGVGRWRYQPFDGGPDAPGLLGVAEGEPRGLAVGAGGRVAMGLGDTRSTTVHVGPRGGAAREVTRVDGHATLSGTTPDGRLLALSGAAGSAWAVTVLADDGAVCAVLPGDGPEGRLWSLGFAPVADRVELLLVRETNDQYLLASWSPDRGVVTHSWCGFDTEITARWHPDGRSLLVRQDRHGRSGLHRVHLTEGTVEPVPTPRGTLLDAAPRTGSDVHFLWTDTATPPRMVSTAGIELPPTHELPERVPGEHRDLWTPGPDGPVHSLISLPEGRRGAVPAVFLVHGGPADHDRDAYDGVVHSLVASGFAVVRVNYRGSTGYGPRWRRAFGEGVGLTQVADLVAVRADLVDRGVVRADATGLWGTSWGGYLVLLALGVHPGVWQAGVAVKPVADCAAAHRTTTAALRALDERLFGGTPEEVPERYARSSPLRYAAAVEAPLLVAAATRDAKCPPGQVRDYLEALRHAGVRHESMWLDTGHDGYEADDHVAVLRRAVVFLDRELRRGRPGTTTPRTTRSDRGGETGRVRSSAPAGTGTTHTERSSGHAEGHHPQ